MAKKKKPKSLVQMAAIMAAKDAQLKVETGRVPIVLSVEALIALLWDKFQRHVTGDKLALLDAASDCILMLAKDIGEQQLVTDVKNADLEVEVVDEYEEEGRFILCPKCAGEKMKCTIFAGATVEICDDCANQFEAEAKGDKDVAIENYGKWLAEVMG